MNDNLLLPPPPLAIGMTCKKVKGAMYINEPVCIISIDTHTSATTNIYRCVPVVDGYVQYSAATAHCGEDWLQPIRSPRDTLVLHIETLLKVLWKTDKITANVGKVWITFRDEENTKFIKYDMVDSQYSCSPTPHFVLTLISRLSKIIKDGE